MIHIKVSGNLPNSLRNHVLCQFFIRYEEESMNKNKSYNLGSQVYAYSVKAVIISNQILQTLVTFWVNARLNCAFDKIIKTQPIINK